MKTYKNLYEKFISEENIRLSIINASKHKRKRKDVKRALNNPNYEKIIEEYAANYKNRKHTPKEIYDGISRKRRTIIVPSFEEQVVHHMVVNVMQPMFRKGMYEHTYASIPQRGGHKGKKYIERWISNGGKDIKYCFKMDIRKFFDSISHDILKEKLRRKIKDERFLKILFEIIDVTESGIPLGFYTSQWLANWFLQDLDHYIKEELGAKYYMRYMDDMVIFASNKKKLHQMKDAIECYLKTELGLEIKQNWQVFRFHYIDRKTGEEKGRFLDFMGFRFYRNRTTLRRSIYFKACRKANKMSKKDKVTIHDCKQMLSYLGWIKSTDTYSAYEKYIKPKVDFGKLKKRISNYDRRNNNVKFNMEKEREHSVPTDCCCI